MLILEHLDGKQDYELLLLDRRGLIDLEALRAWLRGETTPQPAEVAVKVDVSELADLMAPAGPRGGRLPR